MKTPCICFAFTLSMLFACHREIVPSNRLALYKTEQSGCFDLHVRTEVNYPILTDTLTYEIQGDTLLLQADLPYNCCGSLTDSVSIEGDLFKSYTKDTCRQNCLCNCLCAFKYTYYITGYKGKTSCFQLYIKGHDTKEFRLWKEICIFGK